jgi:hypothetical protein
MDAGTVSDLFPAGAGIAGTQQRVGLDRWGGFVLAAADMASTITVTNAPPQIAKSDALKAAAGAFGVPANKRNCSGMLRDWLTRMGIAPPAGATANDMSAAMDRPGSGWRRVDTWQEAAVLANAGRVVVGGLANPSGSGHVVGVLPGDPRPAGGFVTNLGKPIPETGELYSPSLSGSISAYTGAISNGNRTIRDAWNDKDWPNVHFWVKE